jgi:benzoyl-CoA reductase/2-hydroxyglutaryl-CoA dehydratase subunit BcrC/BadD/HgdB
MKRRTLEYNFDWLLWTAFVNGPKLANGTLKEAMSFMRLVPTFAPVMGFFGAAAGEAGRLNGILSEGYLKGILNAPKEGKKLVLTTFMGSQLLLNAFDGIQPVCAEVLTGMASSTFRQGAGEYYDYCVEKGMTETSCSGQRGIVGAVLAGLTGAKPDVVFVGSSGPCDTNCNAMQFYADYARIPMITVDTPARLVDAEDAVFELKELENAIEQLETLTGGRLNEDKLRDLLTEMKLQNEIVMELFEYMRMVPNPVSCVMQYLIAGTQTPGSGHPLRTKILEEILKQAKQNAKEGKAGTFSGKEKARIFTFYIDNYNMDANFYHWCMDNDFTVIPSIVGTNWYEGMNYTKDHEDECYSIDTTDRHSMIKTIAALNSRLAMNKQLRGPIRDKAQWLDDTKIMAKLMKADYLIYMGSYGCRNTWSINKIMQREMEKLGYPTMMAFIDAFDLRSVSWESFKQQLDEFVSIRRKAA